MGIVADQDGRSGCCGFERTHDGSRSPEYLSAEQQSFSEHEQMLFTKAVSVAESFGKKVSLLVVPAGDIFAALAQGANSLEVDSVVSGISSSMTPEDQAFHLGQAWEALPEPKRQFNFFVIGSSGETSVFYIGPHAPTLSPDDVQLVHRLWLNMKRDPSVQDLHHSDIITYALTRLAGQYAREKAEILRELRTIVLQRHQVYVWVIRNYRHRHRLLLQPIRSLRQ